MTAMTNMDSTSGSSQSLMHRFKVRATCWQSCYVFRFSFWLRLDLKYSRGSTPSSSLMVLHDFNMEARSFRAVVLDLRFMICLQEIAARHRVGSGECI